MTGKLDAWAWWEGRHSLTWRRVKHDDGRAGRVVDVRHNYYSKAEARTIDAVVHWDGTPAHEEERVDTRYVTLQAAPELHTLADVESRHVIFRGTKEQVAERWKLLVEGGARGLSVEFSNTMSARRWRIVRTTWMFRDQVAAMPSEAIGSAFTRKVSADWLRGDL